MVFEFIGGIVFGTIMLTFYFIASPKGFLWLRKMYIKWKIDSIKESNKTIHWCKDAIKQLKDAENQKGE